MSGGRGFKAEEFIKGAQNAVEWALRGVQSSFAAAITRLNDRKQGVANQGRHVQELRAGVDGSPKPVKATLDEELAAWRKNSSWTDLPPNLEVTVPKGSLCLLRSEFSAGIPPDAVFDILIDPENKRVFRDVKGVTFREVVEDDGERQLVEIEQSAIWRFLWFSGTLNVRVFVDQDRGSHTVKFWLAKQGFMTKFQGSWQIEPIYVDVHESTPTPETKPGRVASRIKLQQELQPTLIPPPPISWYVREITRKSLQTLLQDLQAEGKRLREGARLEEAADAELLHHVDRELENSPIFRRQLKPGFGKNPGASRRKARRSRLRDKVSLSPRAA